MNTPQNVTQITPTAEKTNVIQPKVEFGLEHSPDAYVISVHMRNMMATYGDKFVLSVVAELFLKQAATKRGKTQQTATGEEL